MREREGANGRSPVRRPPFEIVAGPRGSLVHVRNRRTGACCGCIGAGLYEIVRALVLAEPGAQGSDEGGGRPGREHDGP